MATISTDAETLAANSRCYACVPPEMRGPVLIYVLAKLAGLEGQTTAQLVEAAKCYYGMDDNTARALQLYLLNVIATNSE